ncbi:MAG TPA: diguanylate cyclase [Trichormus sp.]|jgi:diguanylate cyclase (GGDEF)-like protein
MTPEKDISDLKLALLSSIELDEVADAVAKIVTQLTEPQAIAIMLWDQDLESFGDKYLFGPRKKDLTKLCDAIADAAEAPEKELSELDCDDLNVKLPSELEPVFCYRVENDSQLVACVLIAGAENQDEKELKESFAGFPFVQALSNAWQFRDLQRENDRLRSQYEHMEDKTSNLEDQTRKLINDLTTRDSIRTRQVERDRLVYSISNTVRSSVNIQKVLETAVQQIGSTFDVSRCLILRSVDTTDQLTVFEFTQQDIAAIQSLFFSDAGLQFASQVLTRFTPHEIDAQNVDKLGYDSEFLRTMQIQSGLIVPLVMRERILGAMFLQHCSETKEWSIDDVSLVGALADNLSVAIENAELHREREQQAVTDGLTGVANRRSFTETFSREFERAKRYGEPLSLVIIDLDLLKKINDTYGHQAGDEAIKSIGKMLKQSSRSVDLPARYGGEEFCLLLPNTDIEMAEQSAERLRRLINDVEIQGPGKISASLGVATYPQHADDPDALFQRADEALYVAKQSGRNRVCVAQSIQAADPSEKKTRAEAEPHPSDGNGGGEKPSAPDPQSSKLLT